MGRGAGRGSGPYAPKVSRIELSDRHIRLRLIAAAVFFVISVTAISYGVSQLTKVDEGWQTVTVSGEGAEYAAPFALVYELGAEGRSARSESRELKRLYLAACQEAGKAFDTGVAGAGTGVEASSGQDAGTGAGAASGSLQALNDAPGEAMELSPVLYEAFALMERSGDRTAYLGPAFRLYENVVSCTEDWQLEDVDPERSDMLRELFARITAYAGDPDSVSVELLGENKARLRLSAEYREFLAEEELGGALGFGWMENAFITDYIAETLAAAGYRRGSISSYDGFTRNLDDRDLSYSLNLFGCPDGVPLQAGRLDYEGPMAFVSYRNFPVNDMDSRRIYVTADGERKTMYLSPEDGLPRTGGEGLTAYSDTLGCAEIAVLTAPVFLREKTSAEELRRITGSGVGAVLIEGRRILAAGPETAESESAGASAGGGTPEAAGSVSAGAAPGGVALTNLHEGYEVEVID